MLEDVVSRRTRGADKARAFDLVAALVATYVDGTGSSRTLEATGKESVVSVP